MTSLQRFALILALTAMWSPSFLFIKLALTDFGPLTIASLRVTLGAILLLVILLMRGGRLPTDVTFWRHAGVMALFASVTPFYLFSFAEQSIESALAAILNGTSPMFTAILAQVFLPSDRLTRQKAIGIALSSCGLVLLFAPNILSGMAASVTGIMAATLASLSYAISHIYAKKYIASQKPFVAPTAQLLMSSLYLVPLALLFETPFSHTPSLLAVGGILGLTLFGTVIAFILYYQLLDASGPTAVSTVACFFPAGGLMLGYLFLDEALSLTSLMASGLILLGLVTVNDLLPKKAVAGASR